MLTRQDSETLTRVGPGTKMGAMMREYWIPAASSAEVASDGPPMRLLLLGEKLIAFRDAKGRVGIMDQRCPHRCASLFLGRNEGDGLRCVYHGWKYDVEGNCLDMPNVPPHQDFKDKVRARAYRVVERNGLIWVYMGARAQPPALPAIEATLLPEHGRHICFVQRECNWLQALEGEIDTSHFGFLHAGHLDAATMSPNDPNYYTVLNRMPEYHFAETECGTMYAAYRDADAANLYWRFAQFMFPFWTLIPAGEFTTDIIARAWVPLDDTHTMFIMVSSRPVMAPELLPNTTDWYGRFRGDGNERNDYHIDREAQRRNESFTGIASIHMQDQAVTESMGPIIDHQLETLAPSDLMIVQTRRRILHAVEAHANQGVVPPGVDQPGVYCDARGGQFLTPRNVEWRDAYRQKLAVATRAATLVGTAAAQ